MRFTDCIVITGESCKKFDGNKDYISTGAVDVDHIDQNQIESVSYDSKPSRANLMTDDKSILFAKMQGTKKVLLINENLKENIYSTGFFSVAPKNNILNKECLYHLLGSKTFLNQKDKYCSGATQKAITLDGLNKIEINIPKFKEQNQIAKRLDVIKRILDSYDSILKKYDELIKSRFIEMFGDPIANSKKLVTVSLKDILVLKAGDFTESSNIFEEQSDSHPYPCYGGNGIRGFVSEYNQVGEYSLIGRQGALSGNIQYATGKFKNTEHALLVTPLMQMNSIWLNQLLINLDLKRYQTGAAQPGISVKNLQEIQIIMVPITEQNRFANFVQQVDKSKLAVQKSLEKTQQLFDSLMQEYFG